MLRVVLDTNVFISALKFRGKPAQVIALAQQRRFQLLTSSPIRRETERILGEKFKLPSAEIMLGCRPLWRMSSDVEARGTLTACSDPDDNRILECAVFGRADYIVSGDKHLLSMHPYQNIGILRVDDFLSLDDWQ
jgi:putative PIN family toxin of toxin-antitoxin system